MTWDGPTRRNRVLRTAVYEEWDGRGGLRTASGRAKASEGTLKHAGMAMPPLVKYNGDCRR